MKRLNEFRKFGDDITDIIIRDRLSAECHDNVGFGRFEATLAGGDSRLLLDVQFGEEVKYTSSFGLSELPQALRVLQLAANYVEQQEAGVSLSD